MSESDWPTERLNALRLGRRLVAEVAASSSGRRAFVEIRPQVTSADRNAARAGWTKSDDQRPYRLSHWEYDADRLDGFDYDIGAVLIRTAHADDEAALLRTIGEWSLSPADFTYPWNTDDPT